MVKKINDEIAPAEQLVKGDHARLFIAQLVEKRADFLEMHLLAGKQVSELGDTITSFRRDTKDALLANCRRKKNKTSYGAIGQPVNWDLQASSACNRARVANLSSPCWLSWTALPLRDRSAHSQWRFGLRSSRWVGG